MARRSEARTCANSSGHRSQSVVSTPESSEPNVNVIIPPVPPKGSRVHIVAPSGPFDRSLFWRALGWLARHFRPHFARSIFERESFWAGTDERRRLEFQSALDDPEATAIIVTRGGWGAARFANALDYSGFLDRPKWLVGFSDPTILHMRSWQLGIASIHASNLVALGRADDEARSEWLNALNSPMKPRVLSGDSLSRGRATGTLVGGNLTVLLSGLSAGNLRFPDRCILALEDVTESSYRIDRMMCALVGSGVMDRVAAVALGEFVDCDPGIHGTSVDHVLAKHLRPMGIPVVRNLPFGHGRRNSPLLFGIPAVLDGDQGQLRLGAIL